MAPIKKYFSDSLSWFMDDSQTAIVLLFLAVVACVPQIIIHQNLPVIILNDSVWYLDYTRYFVGAGYVPDYYASSKPVHAMLAYPLGYPLFLDFCRLWGPIRDWGNLITLFQHLLSLCSVLLIFLIGARIGRRVEGFCAALAYAFYLPRLMYAQAIMAETLCVFLTLVSVYVFFGIFFRERSRTTGVLLGVITAFSILTKPLAILSAFVFVIYLLVLPAHRKTILGFIISLAIIIFANFYYNWYFYGEFVFTTLTGCHLADRVLGYDRAMDNKNPETKKIISQCFQSRLAFRFPGDWWDYMHALRSNGLSPQEADQLVMKAAIAGIRLKPLGYMNRTFLVFRKNIFEEDYWVYKKWLLNKKDYFQHLHDWSTYPGGILSPEEYAARHKMLTTIGINYPECSWHQWGMRWIDFFNNKILKWRGPVGWVFVFSFLYGFLNRDKALFFISIFLVLNVLFISLTEGPYPRFFESFMPLAILCVFLSLSTFIQRLCYGRRSITSASP